MSQTLSDQPRKVVNDALSGAADRVYAMLTQGVQERRPSLDEAITFVMTFPAFAGATEADIRSIVKSKLEASEAMEQLDEIDLEMQVLEIAAKNEHYLHGNCHIFALALHRVSGLLLGAALEYDESTGQTCLTHAFVIAGNQIVDIKGCRSYEDMIEEMPADECEQVVISAEELAQIGANLTLEEVESLISDAMPLASQVYAIALQQMQASRQHLLLEGRKVQETSFNVETMEEIVEESRDCVSINDAIESIAEVLRGTDGEYIAQIYNQICSDKLTYIGDSLFERQSEVSPSPGM